MRLSFGCWFVTFAQCRRRTPGHNHQREGCHCQAMWGYGRLAITPRLARCYASMEFHFHAGVTTVPPTVEDIYGHNHEGAKKRPRPKPGPPILTAGHSPAIAPAGSQPLPRGQFGGASTRGKGQSRPSITAATIIGCRRPIAYAFFTRGNMSRASC